ELGNLTSLTTLYLSGNQLTAVPAELGNLTSLTELSLHGNQLTAVPAELGRLQPGVLRLDGNRLPPEIMAAYEDGGEELTRFLQLLQRDPVSVTEAKLVLVGEGKVGKTSLREAMGGNAWVDGRDTTHGVEITQIPVTHNESKITLNVWDFGGQEWYKPTHQLYFTAPAVYLLLWVPRLGVQQCAVVEWLKTIRARAGDGAKVHVVATHANEPHPAIIDQARMYHDFDGMIVNFHHIDSRNPADVDKLKAEIAATVNKLPHVRRQYPRAWHDLRESIREESLAYLPYPAFLKRADRAGLSATSAKSLARNAHALGNWIFFDEQSQADLVIFKPDWLSKAISHVIADQHTRDNHGLITLERMAQIWTAPDRPDDERYPPHLHAAFRHLMAGFDIAYRVATRAGEPEMMLIAQLVGSLPPAHLDDAWQGYEPDLPQQSQICLIRDRVSRRADARDGLMYRLTVRFHTLSLGVKDHHRSVHWQHGLLLDNGLHGRALLTMEGNHITVTVRAAYPHNLL
ncbi:COR domain-containing protein, partial [Allorhizocola rhizosphaerae]|uniref:COR domain-containing protein n=1 Tax=Allorhizocola rhizosphaerae TaxID=1872709 RepID=UPI0014789EFB